MTSKQLRITSDLINSPLYKMSVGFDKLFDDFFDAPSLPAATGYPPYNVARLTTEEGNVSYEVTMACAGFTEQDIDIVVEKNQLKITGKSGVLAEEAGSTVEYIHKGIAERNFQRSFKLADHVEVEKAILKDGILKVVLVQHVPEELKPKHIAINQ